MIEKEIIYKSFSLIHSYVIKNEKVRLYSKRIRLLVFWKKIHSRKVCITVLGIYMKINIILSLLLKKKNRQNSTYMSIFYGKDLYNK